MGHRAPGHTEWDRGPYLECINNSINVSLDGLVGELRAGQRAHALQGQVAQVRLPVLQELTQLVAGADQKVGLTGRYK